MEYNYVKKELGEKVLQSHGVARVRNNWATQWVYEWINDKIFLMEYNYVKKKLGEKHSNLTNHQKNAH